VGGLLPKKILLSNLWRNLCFLKATIAEIPHWLNKSIAQHHLSIDNSYSLAPEIPLFSSNQRINHHYWQRSPQPLQPISLPHNHFFKIDINVILTAANMYPKRSLPLSLHYHDLTDCIVNPVSYPIGTKGSFPGGKAAGTWSWPFTCI